MSNASVRGMTLVLAVLVLISSSDVSARQVASPPQTPATLPTAGPAPGSLLPGGASQVQETHGDWRVICAQQNNQKVCVLSQQLIDKDSRQLVLGIELKATTPDRATGTLVLPFGLAVDKPVTIQIDGNPTPMTMPFKTCVPGGCLVSLTWEPQIIAAIKKGTALNVRAIAAENNQDASFRISLNGFASALDRTAVLSK